MKNNNKQILLKIIKKNLGLKSIKNYNLGLGSIAEWDSMMHLKIFFDINKIFKKINFKNSSNVKNIKDWLDLINKYYK